MGDLGDIIRVAPHVKEYRVCALDVRNRIFRPSRFVEAVDDRAAIEIASRLLDGRPIELWDGERLVVRLKGEPQNVGATGVDRSG